MADRSESPRKIGAGADVRAPRPGAQLELALPHAGGGGVAEPGGIESDFRLDARTRELGRRGVAEARRVLAEVVRAAAAREDAARAA